MERKRYRWCLPESLPFESVSDGLRLGPRTAATSYIPYCTPLFQFALHLLIFLLVFGHSVNAQTNSSGDRAAPQHIPFADLAHAGKMDSVTQQRLGDRFASQSEVRVIVRVDADDEPFARLGGRKARAGITQAKRRAAIARLQSRVLARRALRSIRAAKRFRNVPFIAMEVDQAQLEQLAALPEVASISEDQMLWPVLQNSAPHIGADVALAGGYGGGGQAVSVLDSGVDTSHPDFTGRIISEACFSTASTGNYTTSLCPAGDNPQGQDTQIGPGAGINCTGVTGCDHGTHVSGIVAGDDVINRGIAPDADIIAIQVFSRVNNFYACGFVSSCLASFTSDVIRGLDHVYELRNSFDIAAASMSLGGGGYATAADCDAANPAMKAAIDNLRAVGIATVVASGNSSNSAAISMPGCISSAVSVGATDLSDQIASFSNSADYLDLLAPGVDITSAVPGGGFASKSGTSMATPHVAGAWAVLRSALPDTTPEEILDALTMTGVPITDARNSFTFPRIQVDQAIDLLTGPGLDQIGLATVLFLAGLDEPVGITHAGDGSGRIFILEHGGRVLVHDAGFLLATPFIDLRARIPCCASSGLTGLAFHPNYANNGQFFVEFVDNSGDLVVERYNVSSNPDVADPMSAEEILRIPLQADGHAGGRLNFGSGGYLYLATGDGALDGAVTDTAGDTASLLGKVLRIDIDTGTPYAVPPDNPFVNAPGVAPEIWALGVRDPRQFGFDPVTGELYLSDVGETTAHEINVQASDSAGGEDYGWSVMEGSACRAGTTCDPNGYIQPVAEYSFNEGCAVTGGNVYRGAEFEDLYGVYLFGDLCSGTIWGLHADEDVWSFAELARTPYEIAAFGVDEAGNIYLADAASGDIHRLLVSDLVIDTRLLPSGTVGTAYSEVLTASGGVAPYTWTVVAGNLPAGLSLNATTGAVSGTPTARASDSFTVQVADAAFATITRSFRLFVNLPPLTIETTALDHAVTGTPFSRTLAVSGGAAPYTWAVTDGNLPAGMMLDINGEISGTTTSAGNFNFTATVTDDEGTIASRAFTLVVELALPIGITEIGEYGFGYGSGVHRDELFATFESQGVELTLHVTGYDIDDPAGDEVGLYLNDNFLGYLSNGPDNGLNAGDTFTIPASLQQPGSNLLRFEEKVSGWVWGVTNLLLSDGPPPLSITTTSVPNTTFASTYSATLESSGGVAPYIWTLFDGTLPPGLALATNGIISGTPSIQGSFAFTVQVSDAGGDSATRAFAITVAPISGIGEIVLQVGVTDSGQYGHNYGTSQHRSELYAVFVGTGAELALHVTGYDIDDPAGDEVAVDINGQFLGYLSNGPDNGLNAGDSFAIPASLQQPGPNLIHFKQKVPGWKWGVTNLLLTDGALPLTIVTTSVPDATFATTYSVNLASSGGIGPYTWTLSAGALPTGLSLGSDGVLSGIPGAQGSFAFTVQVSDAGGDSAERALTLTVTSVSGNGEVVLQIGVTDSGQYGYNYGTSQHRSELYATFVGTGAELALHVTGYDIDDPAGDEVAVDINGQFLGYLSNGPDNGLNAGDSFALPASLQQLGANLIHFKQKVPGWKWGVTNLLLSDGALPLSIVTVNIPDATFAASYNASLESSGGTGPYSWTLSAGALPAGLVLGNNGVINGTPSEQGSFAFTAQVSDSTGDSAERALTLTVSGSSGTIEAVLEIGVVDSGQYGYNYGTSQHRSELYATFVSTGADLALHVTGYDIDDPAGDEVAVDINGQFLGYLSNGPDNGLNAGDSFAIPASLQQPGPNLIHFKQKVPGWKWGVTDLLLTDGALPLTIVTTTVPNATFATSYSESLEGSGGTGPYAWTLSAGALPAGLVLGYDGVISGTPSVQGSFAFTAQVSDAAGDSAERALSLTVVGTSGEVEVVLQIGVMDSGQYGHNYGTNQHRDGLYATFSGTGVDLALHVTGYDIDDPAGDEVEVQLNGTFIGYLSNGPDNGINAGDVFAIPVSLQQPGPNLIYFKQKVPGWKWGVTDLLLTP